MVRDATVEPHTTQQDIEQEQRQGDIEWQRPTRRPNLGGPPFGIKELRVGRRDHAPSALREVLNSREVRLTEEQAGVLVRHWPAVNADVNQNLSYALQWFSFALLVLFISLLASSNLWALLRGR